MDALMKCNCLKYLKNWAEDLRHPHTLRDFEQYLITKKEKIKIALYTAQRWYFEVSEVSDSENG